jgi:hypothetical protein
MLGVRASARAQQGVATLAERMYIDDHGLSVTTNSVGIDHALSPEVSVQARALLDYIHLTPEVKRITDKGAGISGHTENGMDAVTSASVSSAGGGAFQKIRVEGVLGSSYTTEIAETPTQFAVSGRVSGEDDYMSYSGRLAATLWLFERNTTLSGFLGYGYDRISPTKAPPGEKKDWPAHNERVVGGLSLSQVLSTRAIVGLAAGVSRLAGQLANPYRRAIVVTSLFPENVPDDRTRVTGSLSVDLSLGAGIAAHLRQGVYVDSWGNQAIVPQASLMMETSVATMLGLHYRYYRQTGVDFYRSRYESLDTSLSGDLRQRRLHVHRGAVEARFTLLGRADEPDSLTLGVEYGLAWLGYLDTVGGGFLAHTPGLTLIGRY